MIYFFPPYQCATLLSFPIQTRERGEVSFNIDGHHMHDFDRTLYMWAITYPAETGEPVSRAHACVIIGHTCRMLDSAVLAGWD